MSELYELPEGWEWKKLSDIGKISTGKTPPKKNKEYYENGTIRFIKPPNLQNSYDVTSTDGDEYITVDGVKKSTLLPKNTLMVCCIGSLGKFALSPESVITNQQINSIIFNKDIIDCKYGYYYGFIFEKLLNEVANEAVVKIVNKTIFSNLDIPLPPLQEQKRIVAKLDKLFEKIDMAIALHQKNMDEADVFMKSVLNDVFVNLENIYPIKTLNDVFLIQRGGSPRPIKDYITNDKDGINWIKIADATRGDGKYIDLTEQKIKPSGLKKSRLVIKDDFIMSNSMSFGKPYIVKTKGAIHDGWLLMRDKMKDIDKNYFYYLLSSDYMYQQFSNKASGTTVKNLNIDSVKSSNIILPPLNIQQKTVTYLDKISKKIENLKEVQKEKMQSLVALKASILDQAFRGEL